MRRFTRWTAALAVLVLAGCDSDPEPFDTALGTFVDGVGYYLIAECSESGVRGGAPCDLQLCWYDDAGAKLFGAWSVGLKVSRSYAETGCEIPAAEDLRLYRGINISPNPERDGYVGLRRANPDGTSQGGETRFTQDQAYDLANYMAGSPPPHTGEWQAVLLSPPPPDSLGVR